MLAAAGAASTTKVSPIGLATEQRERRRSRYSSRASSMPRVTANDLLSIAHRESHTSSVEHIDQGHEGNLRRVALG